MVITDRKTPVCIREIIRAQPEVGPGMGLSPLRGVNHLKALCQLLNDRWDEI